MKVFLNEHFFKYHDLLESDLILFKYSDIEKSITLVVDSKEDYLYHILKKLGDKQLGLGYDYLIYKFIFYGVTNYLASNCHSDYIPDYYYTNKPSNIQLETIECTNTLDVSECGIYFFNSFGARNFQYQSLVFEQFVLLEKDGKKIDRERETEFTFDQFE
jgi:hypothetical protein